MLDPDYDDDGSPKYETEEERALAWRTLNHAPVCPECRAGKHRNCDGIALDERTDELVDCTCPPAFHPRGH
jgi:hypothetical protein